MKKINLIIGILLLLLVIAAIAGMLGTRDPGPGVEPSANPAKRGAPPVKKERLVDTRLLLTARHLAALAAALDEQEFSRQALRLADHELDLALADSVRMAVENPRPPSPEIKAILALRDKRQDAVAGDEQRIKAIEKQLAGARPQDRQGIEEQLEVAKTQLELDKNELEEAEDDLDRAGGDVQAKIRRLKAAHDAAQGDAPAIAAPTAASAPVSQFSPGSLVARIWIWSWQGTKLDRLRQGRQEARTKVERMGKWRDALAKRIKQASEEREAAKRKAVSFARGDLKGGPNRPGRLPRTPSRP